MVLGKTEKALARTLWRTRLRKAVDLSSERLKYVGSFHTFIGHKGP